jgi:LacI family transcriptional regulator
MASRHPNIRDVAAACGLSPATASMALRGLARVPAATRVRVEAAAAKLSYVRDPEIGRVLSRSRRHEPGVRERVVFLMESMPGPESPWLDLMLEEATNSAHLLGYELEPIRIPANKPAAQALGFKLWHQGIRGLLVGPVVHSQPRIEMNWEKFAAVEIGATLEHPRLHRVNREFFEDSLLLYQHLYQLGHRRIGLALSAARRQFMRHVPEAALLLFAQRHQEVCPLAPLGEFSQAAFMQWLKKEKPDVILLYEPGPLDWLDALKLKIPRDLAVGFFTTFASHQTGLSPDVRAMVRDAMRMLNDMILAGEWGQPVRRRTHSYQHQLQTGRTACRDPAHHADRHSR